MTTNQVVLTGKESYHQLEDALANVDPQRIFYVTGKKSYSLCGAKEIIEPIVAKYDYQLFSDYSANPQVDELIAGINLFIDSKCDCVVAVGGGSALDIAKAISLFATQPDVLKEDLDNSPEIKPREVPLVLIPTTAGTGSESTKYAVVNIDKKKYSITHESLIPDVAILDATFTENLPPYVAACTGMDAFCQAVEGFWSVNSTDKSRAFSKEAIEIVLDNLGQAINDPTEESREQMLWASNLAGKSIHLAQTTIAHAVSYPITSYFNVAHGHAVALTLPSWIEYNCNVTEENCQDSRGVDFVRKQMSELLEIINVSSGQEAKKKVTSLMSLIGLETKLSELNIGANDLQTIIDNGFSPQRAKNNPRVVTPDDLKVVLEGLL